MLNRQHVNALTEHVEEHRSHGWRPLCVAHYTDKLHSNFIRFKAQHRLAYGIVLTLLGGSLWGMNATLSKVIMDTYAVTPMWLACVREIFTAILFLGLANRQTPRQLRDALHSKHALIMMVVMAFDVILLSQVSYLEAIFWTNSATATILQNLGVVLVMLYVCVTNKRLPRRREAWGLCLAVVGTYFISTGGDPTQLKLPLEGLAWGMACATAAAILAIQPIKLMNRYGNFVVNGLAFLCAGLMLACYVQPWNSIPYFGVTGTLYLVFTVVLGTFGAYALFLEGVKEVGSVKGVMLGTSEPLAATISTALVMGTMFSPGELFGFALIIIMVFLTA